MKLLKRCWLTKPCSWGRARAALVPWVFERTAVMCMKGFVTSLRQHEKIELDRPSSFRNMAPSYHSIRASPSLPLALTWVKWLFRSSYLCPSIFPTPEEPILEVEETHLVASTKQGDQKITAAEAWWKKKNCRTLILGILQLNCHIFGEVQLHFFLIIILMTIERKRRALWLRSFSALSTCLPTWNQSRLIPFMPLETNCDNTRGKESLFIKTWYWKLE